MITVFLSAFLLFQVQLLIGKAILPWFGGSASVWMTCLLFFQLLLCAGYAYASFAAEKLSRRMQGALHVVVLLAAIALLPVRPSESWKPVDGSDPTWRILALLAVSVGVPFFALSATAPLVQAWAARRHPGRSPYRLYALSNAGSLVGLLAYPFVVEPLLPLRTQMSAWSNGFVLFAACCVSWALRAPSRPPAAAPREPLARGAQVTWLVLSACGSAMLVATTSRITQDVAPVPFLWVLPLGLYLLSFVLGFAERRWYRRGVAGWLLAVSLFLVAAVHFGRTTIALPIQIAAHGLVQFAGCYACHGELAESKPSPSRLTRFYLVVSAGGALGGALVTLVAPLVFRTAPDFVVAVVASAVAWSLARRRIAVPAWIAVTGAAATVLLVRFSTAAYLDSRGVLETSRNFYGVLQVSAHDRDDPSRTWRRLAHGTTAHGVQFTDPALRRIPGSYYGRGSGIEACLGALRKAKPGGLRIGIVGMGAGSLAAYAEAGDALTFYEIDPDVVRLAKRWFTYCDDAEIRGAKLGVEIGDARLVLEREAARGSADRYDLIVVDAFSGDAIPVHLLTAECFELYGSRLAEGGLLAAHVSNLFLYLAPVVRDQARLLGWEARNFSSPPDPARISFASDWVAASADAALLESIATSAMAAPWPAAKSVRPWTDDYSTLLPLLK